MRFSARKIIQRHQVLHTVPPAAPPAQITPSASLYIHCLTACVAALPTLFAASMALAQDPDPDPDSWDFTSQVELGAVFTSGNTHDQNVRLRSRVDAEREAWRHRFSCFMPTGTGLCRLTMPPIL